MPHPFTSFDWNLPPTDLPALDGNLDLWRVAVGAISEPQQQQFWDTLAADEKQRAERFIRAQDQRRFVVGRGVLRSLLSRYCHVAPAEIQFIYNKYGKPLIKTPVGMGSLCFNLSHTEGWVVYAIAQTPVGIDLEKIHPVSQLPKIVERFFSKTEQATFKTLSDPQQTAHFFPFWTAKEAYTKAVGQGISLPLAQIDVALEPTPHFRALPNASAPDWQLRLFNLEEGYVGAIAFPASITQILSWQWQG